ncbi:MAG: M15 family metallopeptidase [Polyangiaceae bacterium]
MLATTVSACAAAPEGEDDATSTESALSKTDPVSSAVDGTCDLTVMQGLDEQLVGEIQCLHPGALVSISGQPNLTFEPGVFEYLQTPAAEALKTVVAARGTTLHLNDALRALPEQYVLYHWYKTNRCGITLAAAPGQSNHESGLAVDVNDSSGWRSYFTGHGWSWLYPTDPVHYDYTGGGAVVDIKGLSVLAFQKLWNLNHPTDKLDEDSAYGPQTEARLVQTPLGGFPLGTTCVDAGTPAQDGGEAGDAGPNATDDASAPVAPTPATTEAGPVTNDESAGDGSSGCAATGTGTGPSKGSLAPFGLVLGALLLARRRPRKRGK